MPWVVVCDTRANPGDVEYQTLVVMVVYGRIGDGDNPYVGGRHDAVNNRGVEGSRMERAAHQKDHKRKPRVRRVGVEVLLSVSGPGRTY